MKITVYTSDPERAEGDNGLLYNEKMPAFDFLPEVSWIHPTARLNGLRKQIEAGKDLKIVTWDELTMLILLDAAAKGAELEVRYYREGADEPVVLKADEHGALPSWPSKDGFFTQRSKVLFGDDEP